LSPGDEFALKDDGLLCKLDNDLYEKHLSTTSSSQTVNSTSLSTVNTNGSTNGSVNGGNSSILQQSTSCQNITNLQPNLHQLASSTKPLPKCDDVNNQNDFEGSCINACTYFERLFSNYGLNFF
jgi:hypothetical protein